MVTIIIKNIGGGVLEIKDIGIDLQPLEVRNITDDFDDLTDITSSKYLKNFVTAGDIVINDGTNDLSIDEALRHLSLETEYSDDDSLSVTTLPLAAVQVRTALQIPLTTVFTNIDFEITDYPLDFAETDGTIERILGYSDRLRVNKTGLYTISYACKVQPVNTTSFVYAQIYKNGNTIVPGSYAQIRLYAQEIHPIDRTITTLLTEGDYFTFQVRAETECNIIPDTLFSVIRLEGVKGKDGVDGVDGLLGGALWLFGSTPPIFEQGVPGASYLNISTGNVYAFKSARTYSVSIVREADGNSTVADAIRLVGPSGQEIIIDNLDSNFSAIGSWVESNSAEPYNNSAVYTNDLGDSASWSFVVDETGSWQIYAWWNIFSNRASNAPYTIESESDNITVRADQSINGGQWNYLTTLNFASAEGWVLQGSIKGPKGDKGDPFRIDGYGDFDEAIISTIEGSYTEYVYAIQDDNRTDPTTPINADLTHHIVIYINNTWLDYGPLFLVAGPQGEQGETGLPGIQGPQGIPGIPGESAIAAYTQVYDSNTPYNINIAIPIVIRFNEIEISNPTYFTLNNNTLIILVAGYYEISYKINWASTFKDKTIKSSIRLNSTQYLARGIDYSYSGNFGSNTAVVGMYLNVNDYIEIVCSGVGTSGEANTIQNESYLIAKYMRGG